jgi:hypothetical protein
MSALLSFVAGAVLVMLTACGEPAGPKTEPVSGVVTLDDKPVEGATVTFAPTGSGSAASGVTDAAGTYKLTTFRAGDGAVMGSYAVSITKTEGSDQANVNLEGLSEEEAMKKAAEAYYKSSSFKDMGNPRSGGTKTKDLLPAKYKDAANSGLTADVKAGENKLDFKLSSK